METRLQYDLQDKQLRFHVRQRASTSQKLEFKAVGLLDPASASLSGYRAALKQHVTAGAPATKDSATRPLRLGVGVAAVSGPGGTAAKPAATRGSSAGAVGGSPLGSCTPLLTVSAEKKVALLDGPHTVLTLRGVADWDLTSRQLSSRRGLVKVSHTLSGLTHRQDLRLAVGMMVDWQPGARSEPTPSLFLQARENNWAATLREGRVTLTYDL